MIYRMHFSDMAHVRTFGVVVDDETMTWTSDPKGEDLERPIIGALYAVEGGGPIGSSKRFDVFPGGRAAISR
jgi:hypothetical protein